MINYFFLKKVKVNTVDKVQPSERKERAKGKRAMIKSKVRLERVTTYYVFGNPGLTYTALNCKKCK